MSKIPLTIEVELITCAVEICAEVGEQLIILGGSIVGVYQPKKAPPGKAASRAAPEPPVDREQILEALSIKPMTLISIRGRLGLLEADNWPLQRALEGLIREGKVFRTGKSGRPANGRASWYSLSEAK